MIFIKHIHLEAIPSFLISSRSIHLHDRFVSFIKISAIQNLFSSNSEIFLLYFLSFSFNFCLSTCVVLPYFFTQLTYIAPTPTFTSHLMAPLTTTSGIIDNPYVAQVTSSFLGNVPTNQVCATVGSCHLLQSECTTVNNIVYSWFVVIV